MSIPGPGNPQAGSLANNSDWNNTNQSDHPVTAWVDKHAPIKGQVMEDRQGTVASKFPSVIEQGDPRDRAYALRKQMMGNGDFVPGMGKVMAGPADFEYVRKKADDVTEADFKAWFLSQMDLSTPEKQAYWQSRFGDVFAEKKMLLEKQLDLHKQLAMIRMMGAQSKEDYYLLWAIKRGYINIPKGPIFEPGKLESVPFHRGLFNIKKLFPMDGSASAVNDIGGGWSGTINADRTQRLNWRDPLSNKNATDTAPGFEGYSWGAGVSDIKF